MKAWLCIYDNTYPMTHELTRSLALLEDHGVEVSEYWSLVQYTIFAVQARYEEGVADLNEPIGRVVETQNVRVLLARVQLAIASQG